MRGNRPLRRAGAADRLHLAPMRHLLRAGPVADAHGAHPRQAALEGPRLRVRGDAPRRLAQLPGELEGRDPELHRAGRGHRGARRADDEGRPLHPAARRLARPHDDRQGQGEGPHARRDQEVQAQEQPGRQGRQGHRLRHPHARGGARAREGQDPDQHRQVHRAPVRDPQGAGEGRGDEGRAGEIHPRPGRREAPLQGVLEVRGVGRAPVHAGRPVLLEEPQARRRNPAAVDRGGTACGLDVRGLHGLRRGRGPAREGAHGPRRRCAPPPARPASGSTRCGTRSTTAAAT